MMHEVKLPLETKLGSAIIWETMMAEARLDGAITFYQEKVKTLVLDIDFRMET